MWEDHDQPEPEPETEFKDTSAADTVTEPIFSQFAWVRAADQKWAGRESFFGISWKKWWGG